MEFSLLPSPDKINPCLGIYLKGTEPCILGGFEEKKTKYNFRHDET